MITKLTKMIDSSKEQIAEYTRKLEFIRHKLIPLQNLFNSVNRQIGPYNFELLNLSSAGLPNPRDIIMPPENLQYLLRDYKLYDIHNYKFKTCYK